MDRSDVAFSPNSTKIEGLDNTGMHRTDSNISVLGEKRADTSRTDPESTEDVDKHRGETESFDVFMQSSTLHGVKYIFEKTWRLRR